jgi:uncharacterized membrane protein
METIKLIPFHVAAGTIAILSGFVALYAAKGANLHRKSGMVFVVAMVVMSLSGTIVAIGRVGMATNVSAGLVTAYLVVTALATVRPRSARSVRFDRGAMVAAFVFGVTSITVALGGAGGRSAGLTFPAVMFGVVALLAGRGDLRMIRAGGLRGADRLRRHLWRMCAALFIAAASFFLGPVRRIPEPLRIPALRLIPFIALMTMAYWLWRYRRNRGARTVTGDVGVGRTFTSGT